MGVRETAGDVAARYKKLSLGLKILVWMAAGGIAGAIFGQAATVVAPIGEVFIRLLLMAAIPLVFFNLIAGITSLADVRILGRYGLRTILYYTMTTTVALTIGLVMANTLRPGDGMQLSESVDDSFGEMPEVVDIIVDLFPSNVFAAFSSGNIAQVVVFAIFLGITTLMMPKDQKERLRDGFNVIASLLRELVTVVLYFAPVGVGALAAATVGEYGNAILGPLAKFIATIWLGHVVMVVFYLTILYAAAHRRPLPWLKSTASLYATTAATCSSLASLAVSMNIAQKRLHLPESVYSFTLPLGAQLNKDGTSIMLAVVLLFTAQAAGVEFTLAQQVIIVLVGLILSEGSGGIPGGGLVISLIFVEAFDLPLEVGGLVAGIYRLIDMGNTTVNCMGDLVWTTVLSDIEERKA